MRTIVRKMRFVGENGSLGYTRGGVYSIVIALGFFTPIVINRMDGTGRCPYANVKTFLDNWQDQENLPPPKEPALIIQFSGMPMPGMPHAPEPLPPQPTVTPGRINEGLKDAVVVLVDGYRAKKQIKGHEMLEEREIEEILGGVRDVIEMYEGTYYDKRR